MERLFEEGKFDTDSPSDLVTQALRRERMSDTDIMHTRLQRMEADMDYPEVEKLYKIIASNTLTVLTDPELEKSIQRGRGGRPKRK